MNEVDNGKGTEIHQHLQSLKIGEIYLEQDYEEPNEITLKFNCDLCELTTENFQLFFKHIKLNHIKNNDVAIKQNQQKEQKYINCFITKDIINKIQSPHKNFKYEANDENADSAENCNFTSEYSTSLHTEIDDNLQKLNNQENESINNVEDSNSYIDSTNQNKTYLTISFQTDDSNDYVFEQSDEPIITEQDDDELSYQEIKLTNSTKIDKRNHNSLSYVQIKENAMEIEYAEMENKEDGITVESHQSTYEKYIDDETYKNRKNQENILTEENNFNKNYQLTVKSIASSQQKDSNIMAPDNFSENIEFTETDSFNQNLGNYEDFIEEDPETDDNIELMEIIMTHTDVKETILSSSNANSSSKLESIYDVNKSNIISNKIFHECNKCNKIFPDPAELLLHKRVHGEKIEQKSFECNICLKLFNKISNWKSHLAYHAGERNYPCSYADCQRSFIQNNDRKKHERRVHLRERNHTCDVCSKKFYIFSELREHRRIHDPDDKYECGICGAKFNSKRRYQSHKATHENKNGLFCSHCNINFTSVELLRAHIESKHFSKLKAYQNEHHFCKICKESFNSVEILDRHSKLKHNCTK